MTAKFRRILPLLTILISFSTAAQSVKTGIDVLAENGFAELRGKKVGLVTNPTGVDRYLNSTIDVLFNAPEVSLVAILDADKEGFLRSETSLIQTIGRAARNVNGHVVMYADTITDSMNKAIYPGSFDPFTNGHLDIVKKAAEKMIVVMPYSSGATDGSYENSFRDLMSFVERNFRTLKGKRFHAIAGLSLGGFYAMHISHRYYNKFDYVGLFSAIYTTDKKSIFKKEREALFGITQTSPIIYKNVERDLARQFKLNPKLYFIAIGKRDFLYNQNVLFRDYLTEKEYSFVYHETGGGHEWKNWQAYLMTFLPLLFNDLPNEIDASYEELEENYSDEES